MTQQRLLDSEKESMRRVSKPYRYKYLLFFGEPVTYSGRYDYINYRESHENVKPMKNLSWDELVFEKRNRSYGAYIIRKEYPSALIASFVFMLLVVAVLIVTSPVAFKVSQKLTAKDKPKVIYIVEPPADLLKQKVSEAKPLVKRTN